MPVVVGDCPECGATVATPDNGMRLNFPAEPYDMDPLGACWRIIKLGPVHMAVAGGEPFSGGLGHRLHEHQPSE